MLEEMGGKGEESGREEGMENSCWNVKYNRKINNFFQKEIYSPLSQSSFSLPPFFMIQEEKKYRWKPVPQWSIPHVCKGEEMQCA